MSGLIAYIPPADSTPRWIHIIQRLWQALHDIVVRLAPIAHIIALVGAGVFALLTLSQAQDILRGLIDDANFAFRGAAVPGAVRRSLLLFAAAVLTGISAWYWAAILTPNDSPKWHIWFRRMLGILPLLALAVALVTLTNFAWNAIWLGLLVLGIAILLLLDFFVNRRQTFRLPRVHAEPASAGRQLVAEWLARGLRASAIGTVVALVALSGLGTEGPVLGLLLVAATILAYLGLALWLGWPPFTRPATAIAPGQRLWFRFTDWLSATPSWFTRLRSRIPAFATAETNNAELLFVGATIGTSITALLVFELAATRIAVARWFGPGALMFGALGLIIPVTSLAVWTLRRLRFPALFMFLALYITTNLLMDNSAVNRLDTWPERSRPTLRTALTAWLARQPTPDAPQAPEAPLHMILVGSAGGASRAAAWTGAILSQLDIESEDRLKDRIFAISGVSGGTLGAIGYVALHDGYRLPDHSQKALEARRRCLRDAMAADHLSPAFAGLLYTDLVQRFLPVALFSSRATLLERSFDTSFDPVANEAHAGDTPACSAIDSMKRDFQSLWLNRLPENPAAVHRDWLPLVLANGTDVHTGRRIVTAPVRSGPGVPGPSGSSPSGWLSSGYDAYTLHPWRISASTAVTNSARFPFVSPAGTLIGSDLKPTARIVDGGYFENGGLTTIGDLVREIRDWDCTRRSPESRAARPLTIHVLAISSDPPSSPTASRPRRSATGDPGQIIGAFAATRGAHGEAALDRLITSAGPSVCQEGGRGATLRAPVQVALPNYTVGKVENRPTSVNWALSSVARDMMSAMLVPSRGEVERIATERGLKGPMRDRYLLDLNLAHERYCESRARLHAFLAAADIASGAPPQPCPPPGTTTLPEARGQR